MACEAGTITLKLIKTENCQGCPLNCNQPLVDLFAMRKHTFELSLKHPQYQLHDPEGLLQHATPSEQEVRLVIDQHDLLTSSAWLYLLPLLVMLLAASAGHWAGQIMAWPVDHMALGGLLVGVAAWALVVRRKNSIKALKFRPKVTILPFIST